MADEELKRELEFYKKRFENSQKEKEILKKETQAMRQELNSMKDFVKKIVIPKKGVDPKSTDNSLNKNDMLTILDFQRKRIDELEKENEEIKKKYEKLLFDKKSEDEKGKPASIALADKSLSAEAALEKANERINLLEARLKDLTSNYAKEVTNLRNKLVESHASEVLNARMNPDESNGFNKSASLSTLRRKGLEPIKADQTNLFSTASKVRESLVLDSKLSAEEEASLFTYKKRSTSRQSGH